MRWRGLVSVVLGGCLAGCGLLVGTDDLIFDVDGSNGASGGAGGSSSGSATGGTTSQGGSGDSGGAGSGGSTTASGGSAPAGLLNDNLLARYYFDEAESGTAPPDALDSAPAPLKLGMRYDGNVTFTAVDGNRGLGFGAPDLPGDAFANVASGTSKVWFLNGATDATIEMVVDIIQVGTLNGSSLMYFGETDTGKGHFSLWADSASSVSLNMGATAGATWPVALPSLGRTVLHAVVDVGSGGSGLLLYVDGQAATATASNPAAAIDLATTTHFMIGNSRQYENTPAGNIYYAAIYTRAMSASEVEHNAALLAVSDDE